ncbi:MAG: SDR family oxidoreductase [Tuberibacillus sp.]
MSKIHRTALVTGASGGFGRLISLELAKAGFHVIAALRDPTKIEQLIERDKEAHVDQLIKYVLIDVTRDDVSEVINPLVDHYGSIDVLVNNAGYAAGGFTEDVSMEEWLKQFETNVFGLIRLTKAVLPFMRESGSGMIINMSSISGRIAFPGLGPYSASKFAVEGFSEALRLEMKPYGVHVVLVEPGSFKTDIWSKGMSAFNIKAHSPYKKKTERLLKMVKHIERTSGDPQDVAKLVREIAMTPNPKFRYPIGRGVKSGIRLKNLIPWSLIERNVIKQVHKK